MKRSTGNKKIIGRSLLAACAVIWLFIGLPAGGRGPAEAGEHEAPAAGMFLVASPAMRDERFRQAVVLLLQVGRTGAAGLIINRPTSTKLSRALPGIAALKRRKDRVYFGGPVGSHEMLVLLRSKRKQSDAVQVVTDVWVTSSSGALAEAAARPQAGEEFRVYAGYAGWAPGQLEAEIARGGWSVQPAGAEMIFNRDASKVWPELYRRNSEIEVRQGGRGAGIRL